MSDGLAITVDVDWAPAPVLADTVALLDRYDVPATLFSTHDDGVDAPGHERAVHPNFLRDGESEREVLDGITNTYPAARGARSHCLYTHTRLYHTYPEYGFDYVSDYLMYRQSGLSPFEMNDGLVQFPIRFIDDVWLRRGDDVTAEGLVGVDGLRVLTFHPVQIYLNSPSIEYYEANKEHYEDPAALAANRHDGEGVRTLLERVLAAVDDVPGEPQTLGDLCGAVDAARTD